MIDEYSSVSFRQVSSAVDFNTATSNFTDKDRCTRLIELVYKDLINCVINFMTSICDKYLAYIRRNNTVDNPVTLRGKNKIFLFGVPVSRKLSLKSIEYVCTRCYFKLNFLKNEVSNEKALSYTSDCNLTLLYPLSPQYHIYLIYPGVCLVQTKNSIF